MNKMCDTNTQSLHPGTSIRPILDLKTVEKLVEDYYDFRVVNVVELNGYDDKNFHVQVEKINEDYYVEGYVLKIINVVDSGNQDIFDAQTSLLIHLGKNYISKLYSEKLLRQNWFYNFAFFIYKRISIKE